MGKSSALLKRADTLKRKLTPPQAPRQWSITLEEGEELDEALRAKLGKWDEVIIRYYPQGYMSHEVNRSQVMSCWVPGGPRGQKKPCVIREYGIDISEV